MFLFAKCDSYYLCQGVVGHLKGGQLGCVLLYIFCPFFAGCTKILSEALVKREANPNDIHCFQVGLHLPFPLKLPVTTISPLTSVWLQEKSVCGVYLHDYPPWCIPRPSVHEILPLLSTKNFQLRFKGTWVFTIHKTLCEPSFPESHLISEQKPLSFSAVPHKWVSGI